LGAFPSEKRARVLWAGIRDEAGLTEGLASDLDQAFEPLGFATEARSYTSHLTLARLKVPRKLPDLPPISARTSEPFEVRDIVLFRSRLSPKGARYDVLERFALQARP
jgi:2'-5' RNA ligase